MGTPVIVEAVRIRAAGQPHGCRPHRGGWRGITREDLDKWGLHSQHKAKLAWDEGWFEHEIAPVDPSVDPSVDAPVIGDDGQSTARPRASVVTRVTARQRLKLPELERTDGELAFVTMCCGGSLGTASVLERI